MNLHIDPVNGFVVAIGCFVGYLVYRRPHSNGGADRRPSGGDLAGGIAAALAAVLILAFLLGVGDGASTGGQDSGHEPTQIPGEGTIGPSPGVADEAAGPHRP
ncbi:hypothetical protein AB0F45_17275 [Streptomyces achromogenes]|uniref:hypothetical protein n=1 Tax=Streptomyces achromogenes TaxID=67255 RepID=UPI0033FAE019